MILINQSIRFIKMTRTCNIPIICDSLNINLRYHSLNVRHDQNFIFKVQKTCCQPLKRKQNHTHLIDIPDTTREWPKRTIYVLQTPAIELVTKNLKREDRCLDQINGGEGSLK